MFNRLLLATFLTLGGASALQANFTPLVEGTGRVGDFLKGGGAQAWVPLTASGSSVTFVQGGGGYFNNTGAANLGIGYRRAASSCWGWGINGFFDYASCSNVSVYQGALGAELFGTCWVIRGNGYFPGQNRRVVGQERVFEANMASNGTTIECSECLRDLFRQPYYGGEVEAGYSVCAPCGEIWGFAGYYYFDADRVKSVQGPRLRAEYRLFQPFNSTAEVSLGAEWHYDRLHKNQGAFELRVLVPFGCKARSSYATSRCRTICKRMAQPVRRQPVAWVLEDFSAEQKEILPNLQVIFVEQDGTGTGTQLDPTNVENALDISDPNDVVICLTTEGDITPTEPILLLDGQQWGSFAGAPDITVTIMGQGMVTIPNLTGSGTAVINGNGDDIFSLANNSRLFDLITNGGQTAVVGMGVDNLLLENLDINTPAVGGLLLDGVNTATVNGLGVTGGPTAISLQNNTAGVLTFGMTAITDPTTTGVDIGTTTPNSVPITFATLNMDVATGATGLDVAGQTGNVTVSGGTMNHTAGGISTQIDMGTAIHNYAALTINNDGATVPPIQLTNTTGGSIAFGTVGITSLAAPSSVLATSNVANISFGDLSVAGTTGPVTVNGGAGTFGVTTGSLALTADGALFITDKAIAGSGLNLSSLASTNAPTNAINLQNVSGGTIDLDTLAVTTPTGDAIVLNLGTPDLSISTPFVSNAVVIDGGSANAFTVTNCSPTLLYRGRLINGGPANFILNANNLTGGQIALYGVEFGIFDRFLAQTGGDGIRVTNSMAALQFIGASITNATGDAVFVADQSLPVLVAQSDLITPVSSGISFLRVSGDCSMTVLTVDTPGASGIVLTDQRAATSITDSSFLTPPGVACGLQHIDPAPATLNFVNNMQTGPVGIATATYQFVEGPAAGGLTVFNISSNSGTRTGPGAGISFDNQGVFGITVPGGTTAAVDAVNPDMDTLSVNIGAPPPA